MSLEKSIYLLWAVATNSSAAYSFPVAILLKGHATNWKKLLLKKCLSY
jgi:hypothetical protein